MAKDKEYFRKEHGQWRKVEVNPHSSLVKTMERFMPGQPYDDGYNEYKWEQKNE